MLCDKCRNIDFTASDLVPNTAPQYYFGDDGDEEARNIMSTPITPICISFSMPPILGAIFAVRFVRDCSTSEDMNQTSLITMDPLR